MNWHLSAEAVDYFASGASDQPLDHLWSLAVEEQFYVVWPCLLLALAWVSRRALPAALAAVVGGVVRLRRDRRASDARGGVLLGLRARLGARGSAHCSRCSRRCACRAERPGSGSARSPRPPRRFGADTPFPGPAALVPTLGAAAVIAAGSDRAARDR